MVGQKALIIFIVMFTPAPLPRPAKDVVCKFNYVSQEGKEYYMHFDIGTYLVHPEARILINRGRIVSEVIHISGANTYLTSKSVVKIKLIGNKVIRVEKD